MRLKLHYVFLILFCSIKAMPKRDRAKEASSRLVECYYCNDSVRFKDLQSHYDNKHGKQPARMKGVQSIGEFFAKKQKKGYQPTVALEEATHTRSILPQAPSPTPAIPQTSENDPPSAGNASTNKMSFLSSIINQLSGMVFSLIYLTSPLKEASSSLERSAEKIENAILEKTKAVDMQRQLFRTIHSFHQRKNEHNCPWTVSIEYLPKE